MLGSILSGVGALAGAFGGSKGGSPSETKQGFAALPKEVQDILLETYLPAVQAEYEMPYQAIPMQRAANPADDPFASQSLYDLQKFSDQIGGYFTPMQPYGQANPVGGAGSSYGLPGGGDGAAKKSGDVKVVGQSGLPGAPLNTGRYGINPSAGVLQLSDGRSIPAGQFSQFLSKDPELFKQFVKNGAFSLNNAEIPGATLDKFFGSL